MRRRTRWRWNCARRSIAAAEICRQKFLPPTRIAGRWSRRRRAPTRPHQLKRVPPDRLSRHFELRGDHFVVNASIRRMIVFAPHDLLSDASFTNVDLVICRNTLIYFKPDAQRRALALMHFGLRESGYMFLGPSETPGYLREDYQTVDRRWRIYRKLRHSPSTVSRLTFPQPAADVDAIGAPSVHPAGQPDRSVARGHVRGPCRPIVCRRRSSPIWKRRWFIPRSARVTTFVAKRDASAARYRNC